MKARRKLLPAIAMLTISAVVLCSASYAWFTMSRTVTADGMELTAIAPTNLLISNAVDGAYAETTTVTETFGESKLIPASSVNGTALFAARNIKTAQLGAPDAETNFDDVSAQAISTTGDGYYADFKLWLKTDGEDDVDVTLSQIAALTNIADKTTADGKDITEAVRFAILDGTGAAFAGAKNVYQFSKTFFGTVTGPIAKVGAADDWKGVADTQITDGTKIFTCVGGGTPTAVTVRVWIEGQNAKCISANAAADFQLQVGFSDVLYTEGVTPAPTEAP